MTANNRKRKSFFHSKKFFEVPKVFAELWHNYGIIVA